MTEELLSLKWNNHKSHITDILGFLRQKEIFVDATLACEGKLYVCHKFVLSTCSDYFKEMFLNSPCKHPIVFLKDVTSYDMEALLDFMYNGEVNVPQSCLASLIKTAEGLQVKGLAVPDDDAKYNNERKGAKSPPAKRSRKREHSSSFPICSSQAVGFNKSLLSEDSQTDFFTDSGENVSEPLEDCVKQSSHDSLELPNEKVPAQEIEDLKLSTEFPQRPLKKSMFSDEMGLQIKKEEELTDIRDWTQDDKNENHENCEAENPSQFSSILSSHNETHPSDETEAVLPEQSHEYIGIMESEDSNGMNRNVAEDGFLPRPQVNIASSSVSGSSYNVSLFSLSSPSKRPTELACPVCGLVVYCNSVFTRHMRTHTGEKPYRCALCNYRSAQTSNVNVHMRTVHKFDPYNKDKQFFNYQN